MPVPEQNPTFIEFLLPSEAGEVDIGFNLFLLLNRYC